MDGEDQEYDVAKPAVDQGDYGLPQRTRTAGIWRHLPPRTDPPDGATADDEAAPADDEAAAADEAVPAGPPEIGRLVVAGDNRADADESVPPDTDADPVNPIAAGELAHEPVDGPPVLAEPAADSADAAPAVPRAQPFASEQWREIQASFVDDPRAAVQQAADAASTALTALVASLREQQTGLGPAAAHDTEQLRAALQGYRRFCQALSDVGRMLPETAGSYPQQGSHQEQ